MRHGDSGSGALLAAVKGVSYYCDSLAVCRVCEILERKLPRRKPTDWSPRRAAPGSGNFVTRNSYVSRGYLQSISRACSRSWCKLDTNLQAYAGFSPCLSVYMRVLIKSGSQRLDAAFRNYVTIGRFENIDHWSQLAGKSSFIFVSRVNLLLISKSFNFSCNPRSVFMPWRSQLAISRWINAQLRAATIDSTNQSRNFICIAPRKRARCFRALFPRKNQHRWREIVPFFSHVYVMFGFEQQNRQTKARPSANFLQCVRIRRKAHFRLALRCSRKLNLFGVPSGYTNCVIYLATKVVAAARRWIRKRPRFVRKSGYRFNVLNSRRLDARVLWTFNICFKFRGCLIARAHLKTWRCKETRVDRISKELPVPQSGASITINELSRAKSRFSPRDEEDPRPHRDLISEITRGINRRAKGNVGNVHAWRGRLRARGL